jgi:hypothetical protein
MASDGNCYGLDVSTDRALSQTFRGQNDTETVRGSPARLLRMALLLNSKAYSYSTRAGPDANERKQKMPMTCSSFWTMSGDITSTSIPEIVDESSITTSGSNSLVFTRVQRLSLWLSGYSEIEPQMAAIDRAEEAVAAVGTRKADVRG